MSKRISTPEIKRIPAEIHHAATSRGLIAEVYTESVAGHGSTGRIAWALSSILQSGPWTDAMRWRYGTASSNEAAWMDMRDALELSVSTSSNTPARDVWCPACQSPAGSPCTQPTSAGRREVKRHHRARILRAAEPRDGRG